MITFVWHTRTSTWHLFFVSSALRYNLICLICLFNRYRKSSLYKPKLFKHTFLRRPLSQFHFLSINFLVSLQQHRRAVSRYHRQASHMSVHQVLKRYNSGMFMAPFRFPSKLQFLRISLSRADLPLCLLSKDSNVLFFCFDRKHLWKIFLQLWSTSLPQSTWHIWKIIKKELDVFQAVFWQAALKTPEVLSDFLMVSMLPPFLCITAKTHFPLFWHTLWKISRCIFRVLDVIRQFN